MKLGLGPDFEESRRFLELLDPNESRFTFQTFADPPKMSADERKLRAKVLHGSFKEHFSALSKLNGLGANICVAVNATDFKGRSESNILRLRAAFIDSDHGEIRDFTLPPSIVVRSKNGTHAYYLLKPDEPLELFGQVQRTLSDHFSTDEAVSDLPRVMRLPGFFHMKDPDDPFLVRITHINKVKYSIAEILEAYLKPEVRREKN